MTGSSLDADLIEVGSVVWIKGAPDSAVLDDLAAGGTVWLIDTDVDRDTGEVLGRAFHCVRSSDLRFRRLTADQIAPPTADDLPNDYNVRDLVRALARELGTGCRCRKRRGMFTSDETRLLDAMSRLAKVLVPS